jgi:NHLM bacteriocin system ABC transporter ATP-binding protein
MEVRMGWFDEQIKQRIKNDEESFSEAFVNMSSVVMGKGVLKSDLNDAGKKTRDAIDGILKFYHIKPQELPEKLRDMNEQLEYLLRPSGIMRRSVKLKNKWYQDGIGALLGTTKKGDTVAILPAGLTGYVFYDHESGTRIRVNDKTAELLSEEAICFYRPLPLKALGVRDLFLYILQTLSLSDFTMIGLATLAVTLLGLLGPYVNKLIFDKVINSGGLNLLVPVTCLLLGVALSSALIGITRSLVMTRLQTKMNIAVQSSFMMRVLSLPAGFFKNYSAGELSSRVQSVNSLCSMLVNAVLTTGLTSVFSLVYIAQIFRYAPALVIPALIIIGVTVLFSIASTLVQMKVSRKSMALNAKQSGLVFSLISGVQKIKLAGAERRAFAKWAKLYQEVARLQYNPPAMIKLNTVISTAITLLGTIAIYYFAAVSEVSVADYMAFNVSYGMISGAFTALAGMALTIASVKPVMDMVRPILTTIPEISTDKKVVTRLSGSIELNNVSFRYSEDMPLILDNLSLKVRPGQYVAVVGQTGCGKSTLMRLMLGFEQPQKGAVYFDGKDLAALDLKSLRRNIGVVMQNGKLFQGDVYSNIVISAPWLNLEEAWEAAEMAGIAEDIRNMPMGMHTLISEGQGGISGGQRQRLMIARAIAPKPRILMFDEATSALDNLTQRKVSESLERLKCTRIVIAHRLSTIKQCDRIIVLDTGKIVEDGKYEELLANNGYFAELVARQRLEQPA